MRRQDPSRQRVCRVLPGISLGLLMFLAAFPAARGAPPVEPRQVPEYSFDAESPDVIGGLVAAGDVLTLCFPDPCVVVSGADLGLVMPEDDVDALSASNAQVDSAAEFVILFSVDRGSVGEAAPDPQFIAQEVPYNPLDQAAKGQAAGDQFMSSGLYTRTGTKMLRVSRSGNSTLERNNFDEGGHDFSADPPTSASQTAMRAMQDNLDATAILERSTTSGSVVNVYFSATADSPSLDALPNTGAGSGADVYFNPDPSSGGTTMLYATHLNLGLVAADDIDGLIVFDLNESRIFDLGDQVVFSLAPGSPSLTTLPGASAAGAAADVFVVDSGQDAGLFTPAIATGLGSSPDNVDALDFFFCDNPLACGAQHGIRAVKGDWDDDGTVDLVDFDHWPDCMEGPLGGVLEGCGPFAFDQDNDVDLFDFGGFQLALDVP